MALYSSPAGARRRWAAWGLLTLGLAPVSLTAARFTLAAAARYSNSSKLELLPRAKAPAGRTATP